MTSPVQVEVEKITIAVSKSTAGLEKAQALVEALNASLKKLNEMNAGLGQKITAQAEVDQVSTFKRK